MAQLRTALVQYVPHFLAFFFEEILAVVTSNLMISLSFSKQAEAK
jgi:hypothetical protein